MNAKFRQTWRSFRRYESAKTLRCHGFNPVEPLLPGNCMTWKCHSIRHLSVRIRKVWNQSKGFFGNTTSSVQNESKILLNSKVWCNHVQDIVMLLGDGQNYGGKHIESSTYQIKCTVKASNSQLCLSFSYIATQLMKNMEGRGYRSCCLVESFPDCVSDTCLGYNGLACESSTARMPRNRCSLHIALLTGKGQGQALKMIWGNWNRHCQIYADICPRHSLSHYSTVQC